MINHLRKAELELANGRSVKEVCRGIGLREQTCHRWRKEYGGMTASQAKRMKELEKENQHRRRAVANLTGDNLILKEASKGDFQAPSGGGAAWSWFSSNSG